MSQGQVIELSQAVIFFFLKDFISLYPDNSGVIASGMAGSRARNGSTRIFWALLVSLCGFILRQALYIWKQK